MRVEVVGDIAVLACPCLESLKLAPGAIIRYIRSPKSVKGLLWLTHVRVEVVEISQFLGAESCVRVRRVVSLVVLDIHENIVLLCQREQILVVLQ